MAQTKMRRRTWITPLLAVAIAALLPSSAAAATADYRSPRPTAQTR